MLQSKARITAVGSYVPEKILTNFDLEKMIDTSDEWITQRTGIKERRIAGDNEFTSDLAFKAVEDLKRRYNKSLDDVDMIMTCTISADFQTPSVASLVQAKLGIQNTGAIDLNAACAGFAYGLHVANALVSSGLNKKVLVIGSETMSKITDYTDRTSCILFADGAGVALVEYDEENPSFISSHLYSRGEDADRLYCTGLSNQLNGKSLVDTHKLVQNGREVYKWAVTTVPQGMKSVLDKANKSIEEVDWFIPHSANLKMIESICERSGISIDKTLNSLVYYGNTSSATIPLAIVLGLDEGKIKTGDNLLLYGFGAGLAQAGLLIKWNI